MINKKPRNKATKKTKNNKTYTKIPKKTTAKTTAKTLKTKNNLKTEISIDEQKFISSESLNAQPSETLNLEQKPEESDKKKLGSSSYKNSKTKRKIQQQKLLEIKKVVNKNRQIKVKLKHLEKELARINQLEVEDKNTKLNNEKLIIEQKIAKISVINQKFAKKILPKLSKTKE